MYRNSAYDRVTHDNPDMRTAGLHLICFLFSGTNLYPLQVYVTSAPTYLNGCTWTNSDTEANYLFLFFLGGAGNLIHVGLKKTRNLRRFFHVWGHTLRIPSKTVYFSFKIQWYRRFCPRSLRKKKRVESSLLTRKQTTCTFYPRFRLYPTNPGKKQWKQTWNFQKKKKTYTESFDYLFMLTQDIHER